MGGQFFERGLFAHAPARHELELGGKWARFRSGYGLQDGHSGSVVFVVRGDGSELFRSAPVKDRTLRRLDVDVRDVRLLEMVVEDGGDGNKSDWGVWILPELQAVGPTTPVRTECSFYKPLHVGDCTAAVGSVDAGTAMRARRCWVVRAPQERGHEPILAFWEG